MRSLFAFTKHRGQQWIDATPANDAVIAVPEPELLPPQSFSESTLDAASRYNEGLRARFATMIDKSGELFALRSEFIDAAEEVDGVLRESEINHAALVERTALLQKLEESHNELNTYFHVAREEADASRAEISVLQTQIAHFNTLIENRETIIRNLEKNLVQEKAMSTAFAAELEDQRAKATASEANLVAERARLEKDDLLIANLQSETIALTAQCSVVNFHLTAVQGSLVDSQKETREARDKLAVVDGEADELERRLSDAESELGNRKQRIETVEAFLSALRLEHDKARNGWQEQSEALVSETITLRAEIDALRSKSAAGENLLEQSRAELHLHFNELRKTERRAEQAEAKLAQLEDRLRNHVDDITSTATRLAQVEQSRTHVASRAQALVRAMKDQKVQLEAAEQRAQTLEARHLAAATQFDKIAERLRGEVKELKEQLEKEKLERLVVNGALDVARSRNSEPKDGPAAFFVQTDARPSPVHARLSEQPEISSLAIPENTIQSIAAQPSMTTPDETVHRLNRVADDRARGGRKRQQQVARLHGRE